MTTVRMIGVDPGAHVGLIAVDVENGQISGSRYVASTTMNVSRAESRTHAENDANLFDRLRQFFEDQAATLPMGWGLDVVFEEPFDASTAWRGQRKQQRGTAARLGTYYGLCVAAARMALGSVVPLTSYPVTNQPKRPGWMRGKKREWVLRDAAAALATMHAPPELLAVRLDAKLQTMEYVFEHILMATGVVVYHLSQAPLPLAHRRP